MIKAVMGILQGLALSVSHTTRPKRPGEIDGVDYYFVGSDAFHRMIADAVFLEHAKVFNHYYGTSLEQINIKLEMGSDVILDIDWQGAMQIRNLYPNSINVFIVPPAMHILEERLNNRKQDEPEVIHKRMQKAKAEMEHYVEFDYLIINDNFNQATEELKSVIVAQRLKVDRQVKQQKKLLSFLLSDG